MDDLSEDGTTLKLLPGFNNAQIEAVIDELAKIHVISWNNDHFIKTNPEKPNMNEFTEEMKAISNQLREINPDIFDPLMDKMEKLFTSKVVSYAYYADSKFGLPATIAHSDLWSANILFGQSNKDKLVAIIDWQSANSGNPGQDIGRLLAINTSADYRRKNTKRLLQRYFNVVSKLMNENPPFTLENLEEAYDASMGYVAMFLGFGVPVYYHMPAVVGAAENRESLRLELIDHLRCFQRIVRRSIDNSQPITELFYISPLQCLDQCIFITNNAKQDGLCRSFVYNHLQHSCRLYSHDGTRVPAIMHPANGYDYYRRTAMTGECAGPLQRFYDARANANLHPVGAAPKIIKSPLSKKIKTNPDKIPELVIPKSTKKHKGQEFVIDPSRSISQSVQLPEKPIDFKEYVDSEDTDYSDFEKNQKPQPVPKASFGKKTPGPEKQFDENRYGKSELDGFYKEKYQVRPGSTAGLPGGSELPVHLPNNPSELGYERPKPPPSIFQIRPGSTGGLPGGSSKSVHLPNSPSELGYVDSAPPALTTPEPYYSRKQTPTWKVTLPPATPAPPPTVRPRPLPPHPLEPRKPSSQRRRSCLTSTAYYVVIGNEIILPVTGSENDVRIFHGVEQSKCAQFCSSGKGPSGENLRCSSINYFPLLQKCEIYSILAEPHGPGSLVENDDVIYAEKFCLPSHRGKCQEDEIFILHVQKKLSSTVLKIASSNSITGCLQACLNVNGCQAASFDSNRRRCFLHSTNIGENPSAPEETDPGWVLIENGCTSRRRSQRVFGAARPVVDVDAVLDPTLQWSEWSSCRFKINHQVVRVRTRKCKERCADDGLEIERC